MLESLTIRRIALIEEVTIRFHEGMQVLTGETGAGKSIVVDAVNLILGGRADREMIRSGCDRASVEAVFSLSENVNVRAFMDREGIEYDGNTVTVYREITAGGKNTCRICGVLLPLAGLKELARFLMDLHGQSEHQFLANPEKHLSFLDQTGDEKHRKLLSQVREEYEAFIDNHRAYAKLVRQNEGRESRMRSLEKGLEELRKAKIRPGEAAQLMSERKHLADAEKRTESLNAVREMLTGGEDGTSALAGVRGASEALKRLASVEKEHETISERCSSAYYELEDIAYQLSVLSGQAGYDPAALEKTDERLDLIHRLERKYGSDADELDVLLNRMESEYAELTDLEDRIGSMAADHKRLLADYRNSARNLTASRQKLAAEFSDRMMKELRDLGMGNTRFSVEFKPNDTGRPLMPTDRGDDRIEFMISPNPGEPLKPLAKIASGGELSRLMLAVKTLESAHSGVESMVFDEIDTGISGRMAQVVAEKMITISRERQVICVTHLPQLAAAADWQYMVIKYIHDGRTSTSVKELNQKGRVEEIGRMISGADGITGESQSYAAGLLKAAEQMKTQSAKTGV